MILEEFDPDEGIISPLHSDMKLTITDLPETLIAPFSGDLLSAISNLPNCQKVGELYCINGATPIYRYQDGDSAFTLTLANLGASALISMLEELWGKGIRKVITFGSCGVLDQEIGTHQMILPDSAVRDEGTSYHYAPSSDEIQANPENLAKIEKILQEGKIDYFKTKTWSTDAFFRETPKKAALRKQAGCQVVDMECSAIFAWGQFRSVEVYPFFYSVDHVDFEKTTWHPRIDRQREDHEPLLTFFDLALQIAHQL